ncbi:hypothetical protein [Pseudomonas sp.]|uniref:hypothetical protein n=1 Tax=Pseudomonas sp. TaxID=306 RepID=UPI0028AE3C82|nr:hypothetical protein [Pseudomonas sp.]
MTLKSILVATAISIPAITQAATAEPIKVPVGSPTMVHHLKYEVMYSEKPFELASIYYYDNGIYKIVSPGEDHYGVYVIVGQSTDSVYKISYLSLPSEDWGRNVARHDLTFDNQKQVFTQQALAYTDQNIPPQHGSFVQAENTASDHASVSWQHP